MILSLLYDIINYNLIIYIYIEVISEFMVFSLGPYLQFPFPFSVVRRSGGRAEKRVREYEIDRWGGDTGKMQTQMRDNARVSEEARETRGIAVLGVQGTREGMRETIKTSKHLKIIYLYCSNKKKIICNFNDTHKTQNTKKKHTHRKLY